MKGVKRWQKSIVKLAVILVSFFAMFAINSSDASAIKISDLHRYYISTINFQTYSPNKTFNNQTIQNYVNSPIYDSVEQNMPIQGKTTFRASSLQLTLETNITAPKDYYWEQSVYVYTEVDGDHFIPTILCPGFTSSGMQIDECEIIYHDSVNAPYQLGSQGTSNTVYDFYSTIRTYAEIKLKGHFTSNNSGNTFNLSGPFLAIYNKETAAYYGWRFSIGFSQFKYYKTIPDDDQAAEELQEMNDKDDQDRNNMSDQQNSVDSDADDSQQDAENTGQTLITAFSGFVSALTSVRPTNCRLDMDLGNLDLGLVDLCTLSPPSGFQAIASIFLILFCVPLSIATARKVISLFRSFQG